MPAVLNRNPSCFQPVIEKGITWVRSAENRCLMEKVAIYATTFFLGLLLTATLVGIPLVYMGCKEYGRQESHERGVMHPLSQSIQNFENSCLFFKRFIQDPVQVSSVIPSSAALTAKVLSKINTEDPTPRRYLEVGAGSGAFTREILKKLRPQDELDIVEIDPEFCRLLREMCFDLPNVRVYDQSITDYQSDERYDVIISGLPVHGLSAQIVGDALRNYETLAKPGGYISHFEYILLPKIKQRFLTGERGRDFDLLLNTKQRFIEKYHPEIQKVWGNFPPAQVLHFQIPPA